MPICTLIEVLRPAMDQDYGVAAFNMHSLQFLKGMMRAVDELRSPVIIALMSRSLEYSGFDELLGLSRLMAERSEMPVAIHLDHARDMDLVEKCIKSGFTSVMYDGSKLPLEENVAITRQVVQMAHAHGVSVEGELGIMGSFGPQGKITMADMRPYFTKPGEAAGFVEETGVDALAISAGTTHGMPIQDAELDVEVLEAIHQAVSVPLVVHGCSGLNDDEYRKAYQRGAKKFNIGTVLVQNMLDGILDEAEKRGRGMRAYELLACLEAGTDRVCEEVKARLGVLNSVTRY